MGARNLPGCFVIQRNEVVGSAALCGWLYGPPLFECLASGFIADFLWKLGTGNQSGPQPAWLGRLVKHRTFPQGSAMNPPAKSSETCSAPRPDWKRVLELETPWKKSVSLYIGDGGCTFLSHLACFIAFWREKSEHLRLGEVAQLMKIYRHR